MSLKVTLGGRRSVTAYKLQNVAGRLCLAVGRVEKRSPAKSDSVDQLNLRVCKFDWHITMSITMYITTKKSG